MKVYSILLQHKYIIVRLPTTQYFARCARHLTFCSTLRQTDYGLDTQIFDVLRPKQVPNEAYTKLLLSLRYTKVLFCP